MSKCRQGKSPVEKKPVKEKKPPGSAKRTKLASKVLRDYKAEIY